MLDSYVDATEFTERVTMETKRLQQAHAASCRHAASRREKTAYWANLDSRFGEFREHFQTSSVERFCACERHRADGTEVHGPFRPSTLRSWLRDWANRHSIAKLGD